MANKQKKNMPDPSAMESGRGTDKQDMRATAKQIVNEINAATDKATIRELQLQFEQHSKKFEKKYGEPLQLDYIPNVDEKLRKKIYRIEKPIYEPGRWKRDPRGTMVAKGGMIKKPQMMHGGTHKGKQHSYVAGGKVKEI